MEPDNLVVKTVIALLLLATLFCSTAFGADAAATPSAASYSPAGQIMKMIIGLMVVLVMIFVVAWVARNYMGFNPTQNATLKTVAGVLVGQKERVVLIQVGERQVLIGVAPGQINLLHVIEKGEEVTVAASQQPLSPFAEKLKRSLGRFEKS
jgi:flagellar protein FliO/FliZ